MNILHWLNDTITVEARTGLAASGNPTYGTPQTGVKARVERKTQVVLSKDGEQRQASHRLVTVTQIQEEDRVQLSGETFYRRAMAVAEGKDRQGDVTHYEVWL